MLGGWSSKIERKYTHDRGKDECLIRLEPDIIESGGNTVFCPLRIKHLKTPVLDVHWSERSPACEFYQLGLNTDVKETRSVCSTFAASKVSCAGLYDCSQILPSSDIAHHSMQAILKFPNDHVLVIMVQIIRRFHELDEHDTGKV